MACFLFTYALVLVLPVDWVLAWLCALVPVWLGILVLDWLSGLVLVWLSAYFW